MRRGNEWALRKASRSTRRGQSPPVRRLRGRAPASRVWRGWLVGLDGNPVRGQYTRLPDGRLVDMSFEIQWQYNAQHGIPRPRKTKAELAAYRRRLERDWDKEVARRRKRRRGDHSRSSVGCGSEWTDLGAHPGALFPRSTSRDIQTTDMENSIQPEGEPESTKSESCESSTARSPQCARQDGDLAFANPETKPITGCEKYIKVFGRLNSLAERISWATGVANMLDWLTWDTSHVLGITKTQYWKQIVAWSVEDAVRDGTLEEKIK